MTHFPSIYPFTYISGRHALKNRLQEVWKCFCYIQIHIECFPLFHELFSTFVSLVMNLGMMN